MFCPAPILLAVAALAAFAQAPAGPPAFEVASVKASAPGNGSSSINTSKGGRFSTENARLSSLITLAYDIRNHQLTGGPGWINDDNNGFDIVAKPDRAVPSGPEGAALLRLMVQALLAERFHLVVHKETKELPIYALVLAKNGPKLTESAPESKGPSTSSNRGRIKATKVTMELFARTLSNRLGRTVIDKTGLTANYDFTLEFAPEVNQPMKEGLPAIERPDSLPDGPSLFTALSEQLGLKLESQKGPVEMIVVDHAEKPSEN